MIVQPNDVNNSGYILTHNMFGICKLRIYRKGYDSNKKARKAVVAMLSVIFFALRKIDSSYPSMARDL